MEGLAAQVKVNLTQVGERFRSGTASAKGTTTAVVGQLLLNVDMMTEIMKGATQDKRDLGSTKGEIAVEINSIKERVGTQQGYIEAALQKDRWE